MAVRRSRLHPAALAARRVWVEWGGGIQHEAPDPTGEFKIRAGGEGARAPLPLRHLGAPLGLGWFLERQRPLSFASRIVLSRFNLSPRALGLGFGAPLNPRASVRPVQRGGGNRRT